MTLEILEGTSLDLGPEFWAVVVLVALVVIEVFQLGPHQFSRVSKKEKKPKIPTVSVSKVGGARRRRRHAPAPISVALFRDCVVNIHYFGEQDHALLYVGPGGEDMELRPKPQVPEHGTEVTPPSNELDNYVVAYGEDPETVVLEQLLTLWSARERSDAKYLVLYCSRLPSTYAVQRIAEVLQAAGYTDRVGVSVLYQAGEKRREEEEEGGVEGKADHLKEAGITLNKIE